MTKKAIKQNFKDVFSNRVWSLDPGAMSGTKAWFCRTSKIIRMTFDTFAENRMGFQCVALSYFVALAIIPLFAFVFYVSGGLGMSDRIAHLLYRIVPDALFTDILMEKAENLLVVAGSSTFGLVSVLMFVWTILWLMFQTERVFNNVWGIRKIPRNIFKRFGYYLVVLLCTPFMIMAFASGIAFYTNMTSLIGIDFNEIRHLRRFLAWAGIGIFCIGTFASVYKYIPVCKVYMANAFKAALVSGVIFTVFQFLYLKTQIFVMRLNLVYGALATIPLFLIWVNFSWQIIMYGAQLSYSFQNVDQNRRSRKQ